MDREAKLAELIDRVKDLPDKATTRGYTSYLIIVPHHDMAGDVSMAVSEEFREFGYGVDKVTKSEVRGDEFRVLVRPISAAATNIHNLTFHVFCIPGDDGLTGHQKQTLQKMLEAFSYKALETADLRIVY
jgi:hypothetical protein